MRTKLWVFAVTVCWLGGATAAQARYYDPGAGRFVSADTIVQEPYDPQTLNRYAYARNNPVLYTDPSGHSFGLRRTFKAIGKESRRINQQMYRQWHRWENQLFKLQEKNPNFHFSGGYRHDWGYGDDGDEQGNGYGPGDLPPPLFPEPLFIFHQNFPEVAWSEHRQYRDDANHPIVSAEAAFYAFIDVLSVGLLVVDVATFPSGEGIGPATALQNAKGGSKGLFVIGHYPDYIVKAKSLGAKYFHIPSSIYNAMSSKARWTANMKALDRAIARGDSIVASNSIRHANRKSSFLKEIKYLMKRGYRAADNDMEMIKK